MPATIDPGLQMQVRRAARGLSYAGLVHAFGHCSARIDARHFLVCAAMPMGLIKDEPGTIVSVDGALPQKVLGEVRAPQAIYAARSDVGGICRIMPAATLSLSPLGITQAARQGLGASFAPRPPRWGKPRPPRPAA